MVATFSHIEKRPLVFALVFAAIPYVGLRLYLSGVMHAETTFAAAPSPTLLLALLTIGAAVPAVFLVVVLGRLVAEREAFELRALLEVYVSLLLVFAVTYAVLQSSGFDPAFVGMPAIWDGASVASAEAHVDKLHAVFGNALYLSVVTMTTVGFGDITPVGFLAKTLIGVQGLLGIGFVGLVLGQYFSHCIACSPQGR
jgi:voltage-gated potassium channel Kch